MDGNFTSTRVLPLSHYYSFPEFENGLLTNTNVHFQINICTNGKKRILNGESRALLQDVV